MAITNTEHENLKSEFIKLIEEYDYSWTDEGINKVIETWADNKGWLVEAFKKHPNYVEGKFMIAFDTNFERDVDKKASYDFSHWLSGKITCIDIPEEIKCRANEDACTFLPHRLWRFLLDNLYQYACRTISDDVAEMLNEVVPEVHAHSGQKTSRIINKLCTYLGFAALPDYNKEFAKYADSLSPMKITRHTVLSLNPLDYLTMSFGNSWSSCHTIDKDNKRNMPSGYAGQYSSGTMSYLLDGASMVFYTVDAAYDGNKYYFEPKITRQMFHYGEDKLVQGRLYPANDYGAEEIYTQYRNIVQQIMSEIFDFPNLWVVGKGNHKASKYITSEGTHYRDYHHVSACTLSQIKGSENECYITVGHRPICIECGNEHGDTEWINCCCSDSGGYYCADCGDWVDEDDVCWVDDEPYCSDCVHYCEYCEEHHRGQEFYVSNFNRWGGAYICQYCYENYFVTCEDCGEIYFEDNIVWIENLEKHVCNSCYEDYTTCSECGEVHYTDDMNEHNGLYYCDSCYENIDIVEENEAV